MPISPSPTQVGLSVANASELSTVSVTQFLAGEIAYKRDDKTYWSLDLTAAAPTGFPTASGQGRWVPFPGSTGGGGTLPTTLVVDLTAATDGVGTLASPFNKIQSAIDALLPGSPTQTISVGSGASRENLVIPPTGLLSVVIEGQGADHTLLNPITGSSLRWIVGAAVAPSQSLTLRGIKIVSQDGSATAVLDASAIAGGALSNVLIDSCVIGAELGGTALTLNLVNSCTVTGAGVDVALFGAGGGIGCSSTNSNLTIEGDVQVSGGIDWTYDPTVALNNSPAQLIVQGNAVVDLVTFHELTIFTLGSGATVKAIATPNLTAGVIAGTGFCAPCFNIEGTLGSVLGAAPLPTAVFSFPSLGGNVPVIGPKLLFNPSCSPFAAVTVSNADAGALYVDGRGMKLPKSGFFNSTQPTITLGTNVTFDLSNSSFTNAQLTVSGAGSSFLSNAILSGDVTVTGFGVATVVGLNRFPLDPVTTAAPPAGDLLQSDGSEWIAAPSGSGPSFAITSFTSPAGTLFPVGAPALNPLVLNATYNMAATSADSTATTGPSPVTWLAPYTSTSIAFAYTESVVNTTVTFTLHAASGVQNATRQVAITWTAYIRWEALPDPGPGGYTAAFIEALANQQLQTTFNANVTMVLGVGDYAFQAFPSVYGTPTFYITQTGQPQNPFAGGMTLVAAAVPINVNGVMVPMDLYRSDYPSFGSASFLTN